MAINVLSLFDGISCGQLALRRSKIEVENYFASEIDKYAIQIAAKNFPSTIHLGDVQKVESANLPKIDLLIGGSPCTGFSNIGLKQNFDDPRSKLFYDYVRILKEVKPKYFLLENVSMKTEWKDLISKHVGVEPIVIDSNLVSAQNRKRLYWTNIPDVQLPKDKHIYLKDILLDENDPLLELNIPSEKRLAYVQRKYDKGWVKRLHLTRDVEKAACIVATTYKSMTNYILYENGRHRILSAIELERLQTLPDNYTEGVSFTQRCKTIGNGWTVDAVSHIFSHIKDSIFYEKNKEVA